MTKHDRERLEAYIALCRRVYDRMRRDGTWPWRDDSPDGSDVVESEDSSNDP